MPPEPSSRDLHPSTGARFVFEREAGRDEPRYRVAIYLPAGRSLAGTLAWVEDRAELELEQPDEVGGPSVEADTLARAREEALKLARVLHRKPRDHMLRWRSL